MCEVGIQHLYISYSVRCFSVHISVVFYYCKFSQGDTIQPVNTCSALGALHNMEELFRNDSNSDKWLYVLAVYTDCHHSKLNVFILSTLLLPFEYYDVYVAKSVDTNYYM